MTNFGTITTDVISMTAVQENGTTERVNELFSAVGEQC